MRKTVEEEYNRALILHLLALARVWGLGGLTTKQITDGISLSMGRDLRMVQLGDDNC